MSLVGSFKNIIKRFTKGKKEDPVDKYVSSRKIDGLFEASSKKGSIIVPVTLNKFGALDRNFEVPEVDMNRVDAAYNGEAYVRRALDKHIELMFKAGWDLVGMDNKVVNYVKTRLAIIAESTRIPTEQLFIDIAEDLVKYSNAIVIKVRKQIPLPGGIKAVGVNKKIPVAGYYPFNVNHVEVERDLVGNITRWRFDPGASNPLTLPVDDVIHIPFKREKNKTFGIPSLIPVLEDIEALRQAEEGVLKLIYRHLYPFLHHVIGSEKEGFEGTDAEVNAARQIIEAMDMEAGLITTERHKISPIALDQVIDAHNYLSYFERRVFTGLGVSEVTMGRGGTANRSTAESQFAELRETVKAIQRVMESYVNFNMINELLREGGFDPLLNPQQVVFFRFREIDVDAKIKIENHAIYKYITNAVDENEMRGEIGRQPITDRSKMFCNLVTIPVAKATGRDNSTSQAAVSNRTQPTNQKKPAQKPGRKSNNEPEADLLWGLIAIVRRRLLNNEQADPRLLIDVTMALAQYVSHVMVDYSEQDVSRTTGYLNAHVITAIHSGSVELLDLVTAKFEEIKKERDSIYAY